MAKKSKDGVLITAGEKDFPLEITIVPKGMAVKPKIVQIDVKGKFLSVSIIQKGEVAR